MDGLGHLAVPIILSPNPVPTFSITLPTKGEGRNAETHVFTNGHPQVTCLFCKPPNSRILSTCLPALVLIAVIVIALLVGKGYVKQCLLWLDHQEEWVVCSVFLFLYTAVSFPLTWGYILLNLACGYHFGLVVGTAVTVVAASFGIILAHLLMKHYFVGLIASKLLKLNVLQATLAALESAHAFKLIAISRLTPIPFGLQNALFAISPICLGQYVGASALGLLPTQIIGVYLGSTVRSMEEVLVDENTANVGYAVLLTQVVLSISLLMCILRRARRELSITVGGDLHGVATSKGMMLGWPRPRFSAKHLPQHWNSQNGSCVLHQI